ncbi:protein GrpE [Campylobacterota bacterium]|nr:protein GrpE [Campylobacterota bacterium]
METEDLAKKTGLRESGESAIESENCECKCECENAIENETAQTQEAAIDYEAKFRESEEKYIRAYAEFENIKKRLEKEKYQAIDYASEQFAKELLGAIDALDMALKIEDDSHFAQMKEGVELTRSSLLKAFEKHGISLIAHDQGFDPNLHEAIMQSSDPSKEDGAIAAVLQQGYRYKERVLRPSLVSVNKK